MPYIKASRRENYNGLITELAKRVSQLNIDDCTQFCGDWNYIITKLIKETYKEGNLGCRYADYNEIVGMLECCKLEFYRKQIAWYEDIKEKENGIV